MEAILQYIRRERWWPLLVIIIGAVILLPGLGSFGFWEPVELRVADSARVRVGLPDRDAEDADSPDNADKDDGSAEAADDPGAVARAARPAQPKKAHPAPTGPPLTEWSAGQGLKHLTSVTGSSEMAARLPLALLGLIGMIATFFLGRRLASPRAGLIAALVLASFPLFVFESRQLMSEIGGITGSTLVVLGLVGLAWPACGSGQHPLWLYAVDLILVITGAVISYVASAALLGLVVPFGAVALACLAALVGCAPGKPHSGKEDRGARMAPRRWAMLAGLALLLAGLGSAALMTATGMRMDMDVRFLIAAGPALLGAVLVVLGLVPRRARTPLGRDARWQRRHLMAGAAIAGGVALVALGVVLRAVFDLREPVPGERALFGYSLMPSEAYLRALGGAWRLRDNLEVTFNGLFEQIAFGLFPWSALAPIALAHLAMGPRRGRPTWSGLVLFAWAALAWVVASIIARKVGMVLYPALGAVAVGIGIWLDDLARAREQADATTESDTDSRARFGMALRMPLVALFVFIGAIVLAKDLQAFPNEIIGVSTAGGTVEYPKGGITLLKIELKAWLLVLGVLIGSFLGFSLGFWQRHRTPEDDRHVAYKVGRYGIHAAVVLGVILALFLAHRWTPLMSRKLSSRHLFSMYDEVKSDGDELGLMGSCGSGYSYYVGGNLITLKGRSQLLDFLRKDNRVFALAPVSELCPVHRAARSGLPYFVLDNGNTQCMLISNRLEDGEVDKNLLAQAILRSTPEGIEQPLSIVFEDKLELIGMNMPEAVDRGGAFEVSLFFKVLQPVGGNWKIFAHFDGGGMRFQGDHDPIQNRCGTSFWQAGDYIVDTFTVDAGNFTYAKTLYQLHVGFFRGSGGNWTNMTVSSATGAKGEKLPVGKDNRVQVGQIRVR